MGTRRLALHLYGSAPGHPQQWAVVPVQAAEGAGGIRRATLALRAGVRLRLPVCDLESGAPLAGVRPGEVLELDLVLAQAGGRLREPGFPSTGADHARPVLQRGPSRPAAPFQHRSRSSTMNALLRTPLLLVPLLLACPTMAGSVERAPSVDEAARQDRAGRSLMADRRFEEALEHFTLAVELAPSVAVYHTHRGEALYELERFAEASVAYTRSVELDPRDARTWDLLGESLYELERFGEALAALDQSIALDATNPYAHSHRGQVLYALERYEEALASFERTLRLDPEHTTALEGRRRCREKLGR